MHELYKLKRKIIRKLVEYGDDSDMSRTDAEEIKVLSAAADHICNICKDAEENDGSYEMSGNRSYAIGRTNARRDSMGRYSREGYSMDGADMAQKLRTMADEMEKM